MPLGKHPPSLDLGGKHAVKLHVELSLREQQVAALVAAGLQNKQIADRLGVAIATVKVYASSVYRKTGLGNSPGNSRINLTRLVLGRRAVR